jgi:protein gp37
MAKTLIEWADEVANVIKVKGGGYHCTKVSEGCLHCYAEAFNRRFGNGKPFDAAPTEFVLDEKPFERLARARKAKRVFLQSMGDIAHENVSPEMFDKILHYVATLTKHTFLILTKRPSRLKHLIESSTVIGVWPLPNLWLGVSVENQLTFDDRTRYLRQIPAAVRFVSAEPLLGPIDTAEVFGLYEYEDGKWALKVGSRWEGSPDWIIVGGETGPSARPMHPEWARSLRDQCKAAGASFYFKSWGAHIPAVGLDEINDVYFPPAEHDASSDPFGDGTYMLKINREIKHLVRLLDGVEYNELPQVTR